MHRLTLLGPVSRRLREVRIPFAVIGAAALAVHGIARSTLDVDLLAVARECLDPATWDPLGSEGIRADIRAGDAADPLAGVVRFTRASEPPVDLIIGRTEWQAAVIARARDAILQGMSLPIATAADLVLLKLYAGGPQDAWDIEQLLAAGDRAALTADVDSRVAALPADAGRLWARLRAGHAR